MCSCQDIARYKLRWPVREIIVSDDPRVMKSTSELQDILLEQANAKNTLHQPNSKT